LSVAELPKIRVVLDPPPPPDIRLLIQNVDPCNENTIHVQSIGDAEDTRKKREMLNSANKKVSGEMTCGMVQEQVRNLPGAVY
jgi:hypothetical protein